MNRPKQALEEKCDEFGWFTVKQHRKFAYVVYFKIAFFTQNLEPGLNMGTWCI